MRRSMAWMRWIVAAGLAVCAGAARAAAVEYTGGSFRDPFESLLKGQVEEKAAPEEIDHLMESMQISGIIWNSAEPKAVIDGKIVGVGTDVSGAQVIGIESGGVRMRYKGQEFLLRPGKSTAPAPIPGPESAATPEAGTP